MSEMTRILLEGGNPVVIGVLIVVGIAALVFILILLKFARLWLQAYFSRADICRRIFRVPTSSSPS